MSRLIQLINNNSGDFIGLYKCIKSDSEVDSADIEAILTNYHALCEEGENYEGDLLLSENGIERVFVEQEVYVD